MPNFSKYSVDIHNKKFSACSCSFHRMSQENSKTNYSWVMQKFAILYFISGLWGTSCLAEEAPLLALMSVDEAAKKVTEQAKGNKVLATKTEDVEGKKVHVIKVLSSDGRVQHIKIDADTGEIINQSTE